MILSMVSKWLKYQEKEGELRLQETSKRENGWWSMLERSSLEKWQTVRIGSMRRRARECISYISLWASVQHGIALMPLLSQAALDT